MKTKKIIICITLIMIALLSISNYTSAVVSTIYFEPSDLTDSDYSTAFEKAGTVLNAITTVGVVVSVVSVIILGIKYMMGSIEERAEYKKTMLPMFVGIILLFCASTIVGIIWNIVENM